MRRGEVVFWVSAEYGIGLFLIFYTLLILCAIFLSKNLCIAMDNYKAKECQRKPCGLCGCAGGRPTPDISVTNVDSKVL